MRAGVQEMVQLLPEVQRKMLLVERDVNGEEETDRPAVAEEQESATGTAARPAAAARPGVYTRPSFAPLSASTQLRQASNPKNAIYEALLRPASSSLAGDAASGTANTSQRFLASDHVAASSRRQLNASTRLTTSTRIPFGGQQTQFPSSPFNVPPRVPIGYAASSGLLHSALYTDGWRNEDGEAGEDGSVTPREGRSISPEVDHHEDQSVQEDEREETPVARKPVEQTHAGDDSESQDGRDTNHHTQDDAMDVEDHTTQEDPVETKRPTRASRGKRANREPSEPTAGPPPARAIAKTAPRTRRQRQDLQDTRPAPDTDADQRDADEDHVVAIPGAFPSSSRMKCKLRSSAQFEMDEQPSAESQQPRAKKSRKGTAGAEAARRATRSQSVASQATTEADQEAVTPTKQESDAVRRRPQRRSARLSESTAPSSPAKSVTSDVGSVTGAGRGARTRKAAAKETRATPRKAAPATRGVRTRRQAAALEEEDEDQML